MSGSPDYTTTPNLGLFRMWSVDASGNVRARGTVTPSTTP